MPPWLTLTLISLLALAITALVLRDIWSRDGLDNGLADPDRPRPEDSPVARGDAAAWLSGARHAQPRDESGLWRPQYSDPDDEHHPRRAER